MTLTNDERLVAARRLVDVVDPDGGNVVMDYGIGYTNGDVGVWVSGDWNDKSRYDSATQTRVVTSDAPSRLGSALERLGVNLEWYDTVDRCAQCQRLIHTQPGFYGDTGRFIDLGEESGHDLLCRDCARQEKESLIDEVFANHVDRAVTSWLSLAELHEMGWVDALPDDYDEQTGFHPGQDDTPEKTLARWLANTDDYVSFDYLFYVTDVGQFSIGYRLFIRPSTNADDE